MTYKKTYKIAGKIINKKDIINMINSILDKYSEKEKVITEIEAKFKDGTTLSNNEISIFNHIYFEKLILAKVTIYIRCNFNEKVIITIGANDDYSEAQIESEDNNLYDSICHSIEENINLMKKQNRIYLVQSKIYGYFLILVAAFIIEVILVLVLKNIFNFKLPDIVIYLMFLFLPNVVAVYITKYLEKNYPINQFYFGDLSVNKPKTGYGFFFKIIVFIITNILLPIIISKITN